MKHGFVPNHRTSQCPSTSLIEANWRWQKPWFAPFDSPGEPTAPNSGAGTTGTTCAIAGQGQLASPRHPKTTGKPPHVNASVSAAGNSLSEHVSRRELCSWEGVVVIHFTGDDPRMHHLSAFTPKLDNARQTSIVGFSCFVGFDTFYLTLLQHELLHPGAEDSRGRSSRGFDPDPRGSGACSAGPCRRPSGTGRSRPGPSGEFDAGHGMWSTHSGGSHAYDMWVMGGQGDSLPLGSSRKKGSPTCCLE